MVLRGRTLYFSDFPGKRAASVPVAHLHRVEEFNDDWDTGAGPQVFSRSSRVYHDTDDILSASKRHDIDFLRGVNNRVYYSSVHPPAPIVLDSPRVQTTTSTYSMPFSYGHSHHARAPLHYDYRSSVSSVPAYHPHRSFSTDSRRRTWVGGLRPVVRRHTAMDEEVEAFLASTPQSRYPTYTPSFRSRSTPAVSHYSSAYSHSGTPSYASQHLYRPPTAWASGASGWTSHDSHPSGFYHHYHHHHHPHMSTHVTPAPPTVYAPHVYRTDYISSSALRSPSMTRRPLSMAGSYVSHHRHLTPGFHSGISTDVSYSSRPPIPAMASSHAHQSSDYHYSPPAHRSSRSRSHFAEGVHSPQLASMPRSASLAAAPSRPLANYKDVKPPISDTRRRVRDLICKSRKDPSYYE